MNAYVSRFKNYIALNQTPGVTRNAEDGEVNPAEDPGNPGFTASGAEFKPLAQFLYEQVRARFVGLEASGNIRLIEAASSLDLALRGDLVRATNLNNGQPLPRIAPVRLGASLLWASGSPGHSIRCAGLQAGADGCSHATTASRPSTLPSAASRLISSMRAFMEVAMSRQIARPRPAPATPLTAAKG